MGETKKDISNKGVSLKDDGNYWYTTEELPKGNSKLTKYDLLITPKAGLCRITSFTDIMYSNSFGDQLINEFEFFEKALTKKYGTNKCRSNSKPIPGHYTGNKQHSSTCNSVFRGMKMDNPDIYKTSFDSKCKNGYYKGALVVDPYKTYHFFRQDNTGYWSQKNGHDDATNLDGNGYLITDPKYAVPTYEISDKYKFCEYFCVPSNKHKKTNTARLNTTTRTNTAIHKHYYRN